MPDFHYLGKKGFPHADNVNVYDYQNELDYSRYDYSQMHVQACSVNWDQGEAHIGQRVLSGLGNGKFQPQQSGHRCAKLRR